jgi:TonB family protein
LLYGILISLALHLLLGPLINFKQEETPPEQVHKVTISKMPTPPPTPPPTPKPTPTPPPTPPPKTTPPPHTPDPKVVKLKVNTIKQHTNKGGPSENANTHTEGSTQGNPAGNANTGATGPPATAPPAPPTPAPPTPTPPPTCAKPNADATVVNAVAPDTPALAQQQGITGEVIVEIQLDEHSHLINAKVTKSPNPILNNAALAAARQSTFQTEISNCRPMASSYNYLVEFESQ